MSDSIVKKNFIKYINGIIAYNRVSHVYLIEVDNYDTDMDYVLMFIKMILLNMSYEEVINSKNKIVNLIDTGNYPDVTCISTDASVIKKSFLINLKKDFNNKSLFNNNKVYIIKQAEKLNDSAANTILKFLEEPEDNIIAFLLTDNRYHVLDTIISRCQLLSLKDNDYVNDSTADSSTIDLMEMVFEPRNFFINYNSFIKESFSEKELLKNSLIYIENIILNYISSDDSNDLFTDFYNLLKRYSIDKCINCISIIEDELPKLSFNVNYKLWLDSFFSRLIGG